MVDVAFKDSSLGKKFNWDTIKKKVKYGKNRDDELVIIFSARKDDEQNSIRRSSIEPNINDSRTSVRIDGYIIGSSQHSIKRDTTDINQSEQLLRQNNKRFKFSENIVDQQAQKLGEQHKKLHKYSAELKNNTIKNQRMIIIKVASIVGVLNLAVVLLAGYLIMQKQKTQPQINLDSKTVAASIVK